MQMVVSILGNIASLVLTICIPNPPLLFNLLDMWGELYTVY
jgi:hypothetical protein